MAGGVVEEFGFKHGDVGDPLAVWGPVGGVVDARVGGYLCEMGALVGIVRSNGPDVGVVR